MTLPFRTAGSTDLVSLDQLAAGVRTHGRRRRRRRRPDGARPRSDHPADSGTVDGLGRTGTDRVAAGAPFSRAGTPGSCPWTSCGSRSVRRSDSRPRSGAQTHLIVVGDVRLPEITPRFERVGGNGRLTLEMRPAAATRVAREGNRLVVRVEAAGIDLAPASGLGPPSSCPPSAPRARRSSIDLGTVGVGLSRRHAGSGPARDRRAGGGRATASASAQAGADRSARARAAAGRRRRRSHHRDRSRSRRRPTWASRVRAARVRRTTSSIWRAV